jgi:hypothetical protein
MKTSCFIIALLVSLLAGCQAPPPPPAAGMATLRVTVTAEPKTGVVTGNTHVLAYDTATPAASNSDGAFERVDYTALDEIVVWVEGVHLPATNPSQTNVVPVEISTGKSGDDLHVAGVGEIITFHNSGTKALNLYSVSDGNDFDLGSVPAGGSAVYVAKSPGLIEVLTDGSEDPLARIYVAPSSLVRLTHAGATLDFPNLAPGKYEVHSWHPRLPGRDISVLLQADHITDASIKVGVNELPKIDTP